MRKLPTTKNLIIELRARDKDAPPFSTPVIATAIGIGLQDGKIGTSFSGLWFDEKLNPIGNASGKFPDSMVNSVGRPVKSDIQMVTDYLRCVLSMERFGKNKELAINTAGLSMTTYKAAEEAVKPRLKGVWISLSEHKNKYFVVAFLIDGSRCSTTGSAYILNEGDKLAKLISSDEMANRMKVTKL